MNTFFMYLIASAGYSDVIVEWFYYGSQNNNLFTLSYEHIFCLNSSSPPVCPVPTNRCTVSLVL
jgi:hypothetical protein